MERSLRTLTRDQVPQSEMLPHIRYEIEGLFYTPGGSKKNKPLEEAVELARYCHARVLYDFFKPHTNEHDNYRDDEKCYRYRFNERTDLSKLNDKREMNLPLNYVNKRIFHLSVARVQETKDQKTWPIELLTAVEQACYDFMSHILENPDLFGTNEVELKAWRKLSRKLNKRPLRKVRHNATQPRYVVISNDHHNTSNVAR